MKKFKFLKYFIPFVLAAGLVWGAASDYKVDNLGRIFGYDLIVKGPWVDARAYATLELANTAAYNAGKTLLIAQNYTLTANTTLTASVRVIKGGSFTKASTYTLAFNGPFEAGLYQVFSGFSAGDVTFGAGAVKEVCPEWWAGKGDNSTDNLTPIQSAIDSITKGVVSLGPGIYRISGTLTINKNAIWLKGSGCTPGGLGGNEGVTVVRTTSATANVLNLGDGGTIKYGIHLSDFLIDFVTARTDGWGICANKAYNLFIHRVNLFKIFNGIALLDCIGCSLTDIGIGETANNATGIYIFGGNEHFLNKIIVDTTSTTNNYGITIRASGATYLNDVSVMHHTYGLNIAPQAGETVSWLFAVNSAFDFAAKNNLWVNPVGTVRGLEFTGCWLSSATEKNIVIESTGTTNGVGFNGCRIYSAQLGGAHVQGGTNIFFDVCKVAGNGQSVAGTYHGIEFAPGVTDFAVRNSRVGQHAGFGNTQKYGIIVNTGTSDRYIIMGNDTNGNVTAGISDGGSGGAKIVTHNLPL